MKSLTIYLSETMYKKLIISALLLIFLVINADGQQNCIPQKPDFQTSVYDFTSTLSTSEKSDLEQNLISYSDSTSTQIVIALVKDLCDMPIAIFATDMAHIWGIGQKGKDNGVLILLAPNEKKIFIATGYGVEGSLTDAKSKRIIETIILPEFKKSDFYTGLKKGSFAIFQVLNGEFKADKEKQTSPVSLFSIFVIAMIIIIILAFIFKDNKKNGGNSSGNKTGRNSPDISDVILTSLLLGSMGRRSGGGFGGGGFGGTGGFSGGFGGGGFGGGGAGGSW